MVGIGIGLGAFLALFVLAALVVELSKTRSQDITVNLTLFDGSNSCSVGLGYLDVPGASITIVTDDGVAHRGRLSSRGRDRGLSCLFTGTVSDVPGTSSVYLVEIGNGRRGDFSYTKSQLEARDWTIDLSLGL